MRSLAVAQAWQERGAAVTLATAGLPPALRQRVSEEGLALVDLDVQPGSLADARATAAAAERLDAGWVVADSYDFDDAWQDAAQSAGARLVFFDDNGHCARYSAHVVLNQNAHARLDPYSQRAAHTQLVLGPRFAQLRREFRQATPPPCRQEPGGTLLLTFGGADPDGVTLRALRALRGGPTGWRIIALVGAQNPFRDAIIEESQGRPEVEVRQAVRRMDHLLAEVDLALSAGGTTTYELLRMGVPTVLLTIADNQEASAAAVHQLGAARLLGRHQDVGDAALAEAVWGLAEDPEGRLALSEAGQALVDGQGAARLAQMANASPHGGPVTVRPTTWADRGLLWSIANDPVVRANAFSQAPVPWADHVRWLRGKLHSVDAVLLVAEEPRGPVGRVRFDRRGPGLWECSVYLAPEARGRRLSTPVLTAGLDALRREHPEVRRVLARIRTDNTPSQRAFARAGYRPASEPAPAGARTLAWEPAT